ncbi:MAG: ABC transporter permease [Acidimicrobiia bacterium]|nr:ABC transporter permease [Acidimicrobiia bacterium]
MTAFDAVRAAWFAEILKVRRSRVPAMTALATAAPAAIAALFMLIAADPDRAHRLGLLGAKSSLTGVTADWPGLLSFLAQVVAVGDLLLLAFIATWVFGREAQDGTLRYLLALPVSRWAVVTAKLAVVTLWSIALHLWLAGLFCLVGVALTLPGGTTGMLVDGLGTAGLALALMLAVVPGPVAAVASAGRGYLPPLAAALGALAVSQVAAALGFAVAVPWSVPAVAAGLAPGVALGPGAVLLAAATAAAGVAATVTWWRSGRAGA